MMHTVCFGIVSAFLAAIPGSAAQDTVNPTGDLEIANGDPVLSLFLPMGAPERLAASIIFAEADRTAFEIKCLESETTLPNTNAEDSPTISNESGTSSAAPCSLATPITITEGVSTLEYTMTFPHEPMPVSIPTFFANTATPKQEEATIRCELVGGTRASQAFCTSRSVITGLGYTEATVTLARDQISYASVRVTAGAEKASNLARVADTNLTDTNNSSDGRASPSSSRGAAAAGSQPTGVVGGLGLMGVLGIGLVLF